MKELASGDAELNGRGLKGCCRWAAGPSKSREVLVLVLASCRAAMLSLPETCFGISRVIRRRVELLRSAWEHQPTESESRSRCSSMAEATPSGREVPGSRPRVGRSARGSGDWFEPLRRQHRRGSPWKVLDDLGRKPACWPTLDRRSEIIEAHGQAQARGDLQVGHVRGLAPEDALLYPVVDSLEHPGEGGDRTADVVVCGSAGPGIDRDKGTCDPRRDSMRHPDICALEIADKSAAVLAGGPEEDLSDLLLELLVAEALGLLHGSSALCIVRKQPGFRLAALELAGDRLRSLHPLTIDLACGHGHVGESESLEHDPRDDRQKIGPLVVDSLVIEQQLTRRR